jgi:hypothetical protein
MKRTASVFILLGCWSIWGQTTALAQTPAAYTYYIQQAQDALEEGRTEDASFYFETAHSLDPAQSRPVEALESLPYVTTYYRSYNYYFNLAKQLAREGNYKKALFYLNVAYKIAPEKQKVRQYINLVKRLSDERVEYVESVGVDGIAVEERAEAFHPSVDIASGAEALEDFQRQVRAEKTGRPREEYRDIVADEGVDAQRTPTRISKEGNMIPPVASEHVRPSPIKRIQKQEVVLPSLDQVVLEMDDTLWAKQPNTPFNIEINKSVILEGQNIDRYLALQEGFLQIDRIDNDHIRLTSIRRGSTFLHVWDDRGRWTFYVTGIIPVKPLEGFHVKEEDMLEQHVAPFRLTYSNNWDTLYTGNSIPKMRRETLLLLQHLTLEGETPYGFFDAGLGWNKFEQSTELVSKSVGLTYGRIGPFKDFTIRGYDTAKSFSPLSLPGRYFRGGLVEAFAFDRNIKYTLLQGQDIATFAVISSGQTVIKRSFIEGARVTLFPDKPSQYSFNYARGYGALRSASLKDRVFSVETKQKWGKWETHAEVGYDEDSYARTISNRLKEDEYTLKINVRDIEKNYQTITGRPSDRGEVGGILDFYWTPADYQVGANLDIYKDREFPSVDDPNAVNFDFNASLGFPITADKTLEWNSAMYYTNTPQLLSPRQTFRLNNTLTKTFKWLEGRTLSVFVGNSYQQSRYDFSPESEFDRLSAIAGFRMPLFKDMYYFLNYEYSFVEAKFSGDHFNPHVMTTGISYSRELFQDILGRLTFTYRNEEETEADFSFLSGTDDISGTIGLSYRPSPDFEVFLDGTMRNVWSEDNAEAAFNEADIRAGVRSSWDTFLRWDPVAEIEGIVFKDYDSNGIQGEGEVGIEGVVVNVGRKTVTTNRKGIYRARQRAKKVNVGLDLSTIPAGYVLSSDPSKDITIEHLTKMKIDFGLTIHSGIYGVVYFDKNSNNFIDADETLVPRVIVTLDGKDRYISNYEGAYFIENVSPGKHTLQLDVNSIPQEYLPLIKVKNEIEVKEGTTYTFHVPLKKRAED